MDNELIRTEFPQQDGLVYLNHAAVAPWPARTRDAVVRFAGENARTGARDYVQWVKQETALREQIRLLINAPSLQDIALLKNTSEALSVVAFGLPWQQGDNVVTSTEEFPSNRIPWQALQGKGVQLLETAIDVEHPEQALMDSCNTNTRLMTVSSVQYGSGRRLDLHKLGSFCRQKGILFCVDAIQSIGAICMDVQAIKADFVMADAHKWMLGPEGIALFYTTPDARDRLELHQYGWHMTENTDFNVREWEVARSARRFECGSPNMLGIHAMAASLSLIHEIGADTIQGIILKNTSYLIDKLKDIPGLSTLTPGRPEQHAGIVNFTLAGVDLAHLHRELLNHQIICVYRGGGIRFSPHFYINHGQLDRAIEILRSITGC